MGSEKAQIHSFFIHAFWFHLLWKLQKRDCTRVGCFFLLLHILRRTLDLTVDLAFFSLFIPFY